MKVQPARADAFIAGLGADVAAILLFGPDSGLARERALAAVRKAAKTVDDPFLVSEITANELRDDPARLADETAALGLGGGRRAVRVTGAADGTTKAVANALEALAGGGGPSPALLVVEAGDLPPRSSLRRLFEGAKAAAAIGCYPDSGAALEDLITGALREHGLAVDADALAWLQGHLGADRALTRIELDKLALYCRGRKSVGIADCQAVISDSAILELEEVVMAAGGGDVGRLDRALTRAFQEGTAPVTVLRAAQRHFQRLHQVAGAAAAGQPLETAIKGLRPPVFFKVADRFRAQARAWSVDRLASALDILTEAEIGCKTTGQPDRLICQRALMQLAHAARRRSPAR